MDARKVIGWTAAIAAAWYGILRGANALFVGIRGYRFQAVSLQNRTASFSLNFVIKNPLLVGITLREVSGDIYIQGIKCGLVATKYNYFLSGGKTHVIPVVVTISLEGLASAVVENIMSGDVRTLTIDFDGAVFVGDSGLVRIPIQKTVTWEELV